jgi:hypothetical protein
MSVTIRPGQGGQISRGEWRLLKARGKLSAMVRCPKCGLEASLLDHEIAADGTVTPSMQCPKDGCDFHETVLLEGW